MGDVTLSEKEKNTSWENTQILMAFDGVQKNV